MAVATRNAVTALSTAVKAQLNFLGHGSTQRSEDDLNRVMKRGDLRIQAFLKIAKQNLVIEEYELLKKTILKRLPWLRLEPSDKSRAGK